MPGNLVSFEVTQEDPGTLLLETQAGEPVATHIVTRGGDRLFEPIAAIPAGTSLVLTYAVCPGAQSSQVGRYAFTTSEPDTVELQAAKLDLIERGVAFTDNPEQASAFVRLRYSSPDFRGTAQHLVRHTATVDGHPVGITETNGLVIHVPTQCRLNVDGFTVGMCGDLASVPPGVHTVEVQSHVLGRETDPVAVQLSIETQCPGEVDRACDTDSDLLSDATGTATLAASNEHAAGTVPEPSNAGAEQKAVSGCALRSAARNEAHVALPLGLLLGLAGLLRRRRVSRGGR